MALHRIASTSLAALRPLGRTVDRDYQRIVTYLGERSSFGTRFARLFAEPVYVRGGDSVDWYWGERGVEAGLRQVSTLQPAERQRVLALVRERLEGVRLEALRLQARGDSMASALLMAASVPEPLESYVWWLPDPNESEGGSAAVIAWGFVDERREVVGGNIEGIGLRSIASQPLAVPLSTAGTTGIEGTGPEIRWPIGAILWSAFALLLVVIGALLLRSCGVSFAALGLVGLDLSYCTAPQARQVPALDRARELAALASDLELALTRRDATCLAQSRPPSATGASAVPLPVAPAPTVTREEIQDAARALRLERGAVEIFLAWKSKADLDLHLVCPNGEEIDFTMLNPPRERCGGRLDDDANSAANSAVQFPMERIVLGAGAPRGVYRVDVRLFKRNNDPGTRFPFTLLIKNGDAERTFEGAAMFEGASDGTGPRTTVTTFTR